MGGRGGREKLNISGRDNLIVGRVEGAREKERIEGRTQGGQYT